jgi:hypothetical protein
MKPKKNNVIYRALTRPQPLIIIINIITTIVITIVAGAHSSMRITFSLPWPLPDRLGGGPPGSRPAISSAASLAARARLCHTFTHGPIDPRRHASSGELDLLPRAR